MRGRLSRPSAAALTLTAILVAGLGLRLWGVDHGLPAVYNLDEGAHFVKPAVRFFGEGYNPHYFQNPPFFSYILHTIFTFGYGGIWPVGAGVDVKRAFAEDPTNLYVIGRVTAGLMGLGAALVLYFIGKRLFGVVAGLVAAALLSLTFLPIHYGHLALNDSPTLLSLTLCILASVYIYETGSWASYLAAGAALGFSAATKYTSVAVVFVIVTAFALRVLNDRAAFRREFPRLVAAGAASMLTFVVANPYSVLSPHEFAGQVRR
ncbi:MAG: glycosyltransferase family 39 protein, partial [Thermoleophilaceae bacterium]|nr:glycosyltransferase family 39 protein [Thermoleophilaceae bacterium]